MPGIYLIFFRKLRGGIALHFDPALLGDIDHINLAHNIFTVISVIIAVPVTKNTMVHFHVSLPPDEVMGGKVPEF